MKKLSLLLLAAAIALPEAANSVTHSESYSYKNSGVSLTLSDPAGSVYKAGETVRFTVQTDSDAYVVVFDIDTEGFVHLLYPTDRRSLQRFEAGRSYDLPVDRAGDLVVTGKTGMEFVFAVAVGARDAISDREISFLLDSERRPERRRYRIDGDPFLAANRVASQLVRGIAYSKDVSMAFTYFYVNEAVDYPRYLCEDCYEKGKDPYSYGTKYVATSAFDREDRLEYPLPRAFEPWTEDVAEEDAYTEREADDARTTTVHVYRHYDGWVPYWGWYSPFYYGWRPYYGSSFYFSVGWNWGWRHWAWDWYYPYGYWYRYPYHYYRGYYCGPYRYGVAYRTLRGGAYRYKGVSGASLAIAGSYASKQRAKLVRHGRTDKVLSERARIDRKYKTYRSKPRPVHKIATRKTVREKARILRDPRQKNTRSSAIKSTRPVRKLRDARSPRKRSVRSTKSGYPRRSYDVRKRTSQRPRMKMPSKRRPSAPRVTPRVKSPRSRPGASLKSRAKPSRRPAIKRSSPSRSSSGRSSATRRGGSRRK